ncbi:MAG: YegS/Rv2252/BmrU family lipid kinase [Chitinophagales bacterium]
MKILFVINPGSGRKKDIDWESIIKSFFQTFPHSIEFFTLGKEEQAQALKEIIKKSMPGLVVAVGGDGTVTLVAQQLMHTEMQMGIIPAGSANGMATELGIPNDPQLALGVLLTGEVKAADVILMNEKDICLHLSDIGLNAQLIKYFKYGKLRGKIGYAKVVLKVLVRKRRMKVALQSGNEVILRSAVMIAIANASKYGTGAIINPDGNIDDGVFEVVIVRKLGVLEILKMFLRFQRFNPKKIEILHAKSVIIETKRQMHFQIDGEYMGKVKTVTARILPAPLKLLVPVSGEIMKNP